MTKREAFEAEAAKKQARPHTKPLKTDGDCALRKRERVALLFTTYMIMVAYKRFVIQNTLPSLSPYFSLFLSLSIPTSLSFSLSLSLPLKVSLNICVNLTARTLTLLLLCVAEHENGKREKWV